MKLSSDYLKKDAESLAAGFNFAPSLQDITWPKGSKLTYIGKRELENSDFSILKFEEVKGENEESKVYEIIDFAFFQSLSAGEVDSVNEAESLLISDAGEVEVRDGELKPYHVQFSSLSKIDGEWIVQAGTDPVLKRKIKVTAAKA